MIFLLFFLAGRVAHGQVVEEQSRIFTQPVDAENFLGKTTLCLMQDSRGFIWSGTTDGLGRFDGRNTTVYKNQPEDSTSLSNNYINGLYEDAQGNIWVATKRGLNCYDPKMDRFQRYFVDVEETFEGHNYILSVAGGAEGEIWFGTYGGLYVLDARGAISAEKKEDGSPIEHVYALHLDQEKRLWISHWDGLAVKNPEGGFQHFPAARLASEEIQGEIQIINAFAETAGKVWAATDNGICGFELNGGELKTAQYFIDPGNRRGVNSNHIRHLFAEAGKLWLATLSSGLVEVLLNDKGEVSRLLITPTATNDKDGLRGTPANHIMRDHSGNLWIATSSGVDQLNISVGKFGQIRAFANSPTSLSGDIVTSLHFDSRGNLWVGTITGLNFIEKEDLASGNYRFRKWKHDPASHGSISSNRIFSIEEDSFGRLWLGTIGGLSMIELEPFYAGGEPAFFNYGFEHGLPNPTVYDVLEIRKGLFWVATKGKLAKMRFLPGLDDKPVFLHYDMSDQRADALVNAFTMGIEKDTAGKYWVTTFMGLSRWLGDTMEARWVNLPHWQAAAKRDAVDPRQVGRFSNFMMDEALAGSISDNSTVSLHSDVSGNVWIGTRNGLNRWDGHEGFVHYGVQAGFENTVIQSIESDASGKLWLGTNEGLAQFDPERAAKGEPPVVRTFRKADGLPGEGFVFRASTVAPDGTLFFGTASGIVFFKTANLAANENKPRVSLTGLSILNQPIKPGDKSLTKALDFTEGIRLNHNQKAFTIGFAALEFTRPSENTFEYQLEGFDPEWIPTTSNTVSYTNLNPGSYLFRVRALNSDGVASARMATVKITVTPAPWRSNLAYMFYTLVLLLVGLSVQRYFARRRQEKLQQQLQLERARLEEREELRRRSAADFHDELGHRLTKISLFAEMASRQQAESPELLDKIKENTAELSDGVRDLIWSLDPSQDSLFETLSRLQDFGDRLYEYTETVFRMTPLPPEARELLLDAEPRKHVLLIFKEAMNNCLKYAEATSAKLSCEYDSKSVTIRFEDNGKGMEDRASVSSDGGRGLQNMADRAEKIPASLAINSEIGGGTRISLRLEIPQRG